MYCNKEEQLDEKHKECNQPLCAAGGRKKSPKYVEEFTEKLKMMAAELEETHILTLLNTTDVRAAELFYHRSCHASFIKRYCLNFSYCLLFHNLKIDDLNNCSCFADMRKSTRKREKFCFMI